MLSFTFKNKNSWDDYGIVIKEKPPMPVPERNVKEQEIPGRNGDLTIDYGTYKPVTYPLVCSLTEDNIDIVKAWLTGFGDLVFSWKSDRKYIAKSINRIDIEQSIELFGEFPIIFKTQPFAYSTDTNTITISAPTTIFNPGTVESTESIITVYGSNNIDLFINSQILHLMNVVDYVTLDSYLGDAWKDTATNLKNNDVNFTFPIILQPGENSVSWTGSVSSIVILPNWRWL